MQAIGARAPQSDLRRPDRGPGPGRTAAALTVAGILVRAACAAAADGGPLVFNGGFDHPTNALAGWQSAYTAAGDDWYAGNAARVSVVDDPERGRVLRLEGDQRIMDNQGTKVDSRPIPWKGGDRFRFSARARTTGPNCRILVEGYRWKPGVSPHAQPTLGDLRKCYKFSQLYFGEEQAGEMGGVRPEWRRAAATCPGDAAAASALARSLADQVQFLVVHIVAIGGRAGALFVDDVTVERLQP